MKNDLLCTANKRILWLSKTYDGCVHNRKIVDEQPLSLPLGTTLWQDTGFLDHKPKNAIIKMPTKKPKDRVLTENQKAENKKISSFRIPVEHAIGGGQKMLYCQRVIHMSQVWF